MNSKFPIIGKILLSFLLLVSTAVASMAIDWEFAEVSLSPQPDGKATVVYQVAINPQGFSLHGFYFEGFTGPPFRHEQVLCLGFPEQKV
ncbi:MAG: hypothetical protein WAX69_10070 [Victivallales bacterium]